MQKAFKQQEVANLWQQLDEYSRLKQDDGNGLGKASEVECLILHLLLVECFCGFVVNIVLQLMKLNVLMWLAFSCLLVANFQESFYTQRFNGASEMCLLDCHCVGRGLLDSSLSSMCGRLMAFV